MDESLKLKLWSGLMRFFSYSGCHQMAERSFFWFGYQHPLCARCTGIVLGQVVSSFISLFVFCHWSLVFLILPMAVDGLTQLYGRRESLNVTRLVTGFAGGYGYMAALLTLAKLALSFA